MQRILDAITEKLDAGYNPAQLEVDFGVQTYEQENEEEGYYLSKYNGWGETPITEILAHDGDFEDKELIKQLDRLHIAHCLQ